MYGALASLTLAQPVVADCPVKIDHFFLNSVGATRHAGLYQVDLTVNPKKPVGVGS